VPNEGFETVECTQSPTDRSQIILIGFRRSDLPPGTVPGILQGDTEIRDPETIDPVTDPDGNPDTWGTISIIVGPGTCRLRLSGN
jgi:hypothetical protein